MDRSELQKLSTHELHDRALARARKHLDVAFMWRLVEAIPAAQAAAGHLDDAEVDVVSLSSLVTDSLRSGEGELGEALRPLYLDYLGGRSD